MSVWAEVDTYDVDLDDGGEVLGGCGKASMNSRNSDEVRVTGTSRKPLASRFRYRCFDIRRRSGVKFS